MRRTRRALFVSSAIALLVLASASSVTAVPVVTDLIGGLNNPRDVDVAANGRILVAETGAGAIVAVNGGQRRVLVDGLPLASFDGDPVSVHGISALGNGQVFAVIGEGDGPGFQTLQKARPGGSRVLADIGAYQAADPDLQDLEGFAEQSNPYGVLAVNGSKALVADAGGNDLLVVHKSGRIATVARFPVALISGAHVGIPGDVPAEAVPTSVAIGPDGYRYVGELKGFPFTPGASRIWRIQPGAHDVTCDPLATTGPCTLWATGFTAIVGLEFGPDGDLYVVEMFRHGLTSGSPEGAVWRVDFETQARTEIAPGSFFLPGGIGIDDRGTLYVSNWSVTPDGHVLKIVQ